LTISKRQVSLLIYDFDGTLVDTLEDIAWSVNQALLEMRLSNLPLETIRKYVGRGVVPLMTRSLETAGGEKKDLDRAVESFKKIYADHLLVKTRLYPHSRETIEHFSNKKQAILSNKPAAFIEKILKGLDFLAPFQEIAGGDTFASRKPDPEGLLKLIENFKVEKSRVAMIGDSAIDIETGKRAGVITVGVSYGFCDPRSNPEFQADCMIDDLSQLIGLLD